MDDFTAEILAAGRGLDSTEDSRRRRGHGDDDDKTPAAGADSNSPSNTPSGSETPSQKTGLRGGFAAIRQKANIQDRLVEKLLQQVIPTDDDDQNDVQFVGDEQTPTQTERPNFNITTMSFNFRRFNARIGVVFKFQARVERILSWKQASHTISLLAVYSFVCLDPYLIFVLPIAILLLGVFIPSFMARHPAPPKGTLSSEQNVGYSPQGPPLAPAATVKPVKELSKDFFRNMRDLQNCMDDFSRGHDQVVSLLVPVTNFSNEALSSTLFLFLTVSGIAMTVSAHLLPWRIIFLVGGWAIVGMGHPYVARLLAAAHREHLQPQGAKAQYWLENWTNSDIILDTSPETREVEIFELQRKTSGGGEWEPWLFCPSPYDPLSQPRIAGERPRGSRFFEDVMPPEAWEWSEKKWALDLWSREWVEERIITGVEVETEGERWVYDIWDERDERTGVVDLPVNDKGKQKATPMPSWEENEDGSGRRGNWRRRRWVRLVKRKAIPVQPN
ncbi:integral peroxisomal membrane peroxin-domain-containing protein [Fusarium venenatum]|uniref:integral peroxisomal membrane peroxin-domain-containing protein n=1 Tax=Fusarium venenatum TaxID=56646 RepID=UPI001D2A089F|nr:integral peroxisomal membrane peroxin-domain-containing protein [Fusarium venenatum]